MIKNKQLFRIQMSNLFLLYQIRKDPSKQLPNEMVPTSGSPVRFLERRVGSQNLAQEENLTAPIRRMKGCRDFIWIGKHPLAGLKAHTGNWEQDWDAS